MINFEVLHRVIDISFLLFIIVHKSNRQLLILTDTGVINFVKAVWETLQAKFSEELV